MKTINTVGISSKSSSEGLSYISNKVFGLNDWVVKAEGLTYEQAKRELDNLIACGYEVCESSEIESNATYFVYTYTYKQV